jgi:hypothetical protein
MRSATGVGSLITVLVDRVGGHRALLIGLDASSLSTMLSGLVCSTGSPSAALKVAILGAFPDLTYTVCREDSSDRPATSDDCSSSRVAPAGCRRRSCRAAAALRATSGPDGSGHSALVRARRSARSSMTRSTVGCFSTMRSARRGRPSRSGRCQRKTCALLRAVSVNSQRSRGLKRISPPTIRIATITPTSRELQKPRYLDDMV